MPSLAGSRVRAWAWATTRHGKRIERLRDDPGERCRHFAEIGQDDGEAGRHIKEAHGRHEPPRDAPDPRNRAEQDESDEQGKAESEGERRLEAERARRLDLRLVHLEQRHAPHDHEDRVDPCEAPPQPRQADGREPAHQRHCRPADHPAAGKLVAEHEPQRHLGAFQAHGEEADDDHPEDRTRAAGRDRDGNAGDVAEPDGGRKRRRQRLELRNPPGRACILPLAEQRTPAEREAPELRHPEPDRRKDHRRGEPQHDELHRNTGNRDLEEDDSGKTLDGSGGDLDEGHCRVP
jgi:hypothetical protein